jgi:hypothetical protein
VFGWGLRLVHCCYYCTIVVFVFGWGLRLAYCIFNHCCSLCLDVGFGWLIVVIIVVLCVWLGASVGLLLLLLFFVFGWGLRLVYCCYYCRSLCLVGGFGWFIVGIIVVLCALCVGWGYYCCSLCLCALCVYMSNNTSVSN